MIFSYKASKQGNVKYQLLEYADIFELDLPFITQILYFCGATANPFTRSVLDIPLLWHIKFNFQIQGTLVVFEMFYYKYWIFIAVIL